MKRFIAVLFSMLVFMSVLSGCGGGGKKGEVLIWTFTDELGKMVKDYYKKNVDPDANINVVIKDVNNLSTSLDSALTAKKNLPDIVALEEKYLRKYVESGALEPLNDLQTGAANMYDYTLDAAKDNNGDVLAYAWQATPGALYYRTDMAKALLDVDTPEQMQELVSDWGKFIETAGRVKNANKGGFNDVKMLSAVASPTRPFFSEREKAWVTKDAGGNEVLNIEDRLYKGENNLYDVIKALQVGDGEWGVAVAEHEYINRTTERTTSWNNDMSGDRVFSYLLPSYSLHYDLKVYANKSDGSGTTAGKWGICKGPATYSDGGTWLAVLKTSPNKDFAKELIKYFTMDEGFMRAWANDTGDFMNNVSLMDEFGADTTRGEEFLGGQNQYTLFAQIAKEIKGNNLCIYDASINSMFGEWAINYAKVDLEKVSGKENAKRDALEGFILGVEGAHRKVVIPDNVFVL